MFSESFRRVVDDSLTPVTDGGRSTIAIIPLLSKQSKHGFKSPTGHARTYIIQVRDFISR
jgi:hypothetical protein